MERIRILHCLRVYSTYVRKQCKTRIRFFCVEITGKREILRSDSFGFVPFFRIRSDSFRLVEFYGVRGLCVFFVHMLGPPPPFSMICGFSYFFAIVFFQYAKNLVFGSYTSVAMIGFSCSIGLVWHVLHSYVILCNCAFFTVAGGRGTIWGV